MSRIRRLSLAAEAVLVLAGLTALAIVATYPLIRRLTTHLPNDLGDPVLNAWILAWDAMSMRRGLGGLWDAPSFFPYGHTLAYSDHLLGIALFTAPLQWLTGNPILVYNVAFLASFAQAGGAMYLLARTLTGRRDAAFLASLIYAFTPFRVAHIAHLQWLMTGWLPLSLWALHRYFSTGAWRFLLAAAACFVLQSLTASYFIYFSMLPLAAVTVAEMRRVRPPLRRSIVHLAAVVLLVGLALAPVLRAYYRVRQDNGFQRSTAEILSYSADLSDYFRAHHYVWIWRGARQGTSEHELFPGAVVLMLAGIALLPKSYRTVSHVPVYATLAAAAFVLSLGPRPTAWGHQSVLPGPYQVLLAMVPGLSGLRAVARLNAVVVLALAVLAAYGAIRLLDRIAPRRRPLVVTSLAVAIAAEGWAAPIPTARFDPLADTQDRDAYEYLRHSDQGAVLEMPISLQNGERELKYQYLTLVHGHRTVNGHSSYEAPLLTFLGGGDQSPLNDFDHLGVGIEMMRAIGVRYIVVHAGDFENQALGDALIRELETDQRQVVARRYFGRTAVFALAADSRPAEPNGPSMTVRSSESMALRPIPASAIQPRASHEPRRLPLAFDRNPDTRWLTGDRQNGSEWIELAFDRPRDVGLLRMQTAVRSFGDYPRELTIDVIEDAGTRTVFRGSVLPEFGRGFVVNHAYPNIDLVLPENHSRGLRLRQLGATNKFYWSIHELQVWER